MESYKLALIFALCMTLCYAKVDAGSDANSVNPAEKSVNSTAPAEKQPSPISSSYFPSDLSWKTGFGQGLVVVGAAALGFVLLGGLTLLLAPVFGYKPCQLLGNCDPAAVAYSAGGNAPTAAQAQSNSYPDLYGTYYAAPYANYQKRSIEYIKPILETLAKTYEKSS